MLATCPCGDRFEVEVRAPDRILGTGHLSFVTCMSCGMPAVWRSFGLRLFEVCDRADGSTVEGVWATSAEDALAVLAETHGGDVEELRARYVVALAP